MKSSKLELMNKNKLFTCQIPQDILINLEMRQMQHKVPFFTKILEEGKK